MEENGPAADGRTQASRLFRAIALIAAQASVVLWGALLLGSRGGRAHPLLPLAGLEIALAGLASLAAFLRRPYLMYGLFLASFVPLAFGPAGIGSFGSAAGALDIVYAAAAVGMHRAMRKRY